MSVQSTYRIIIKLLFSNELLITPDLVEWILLNNSVFVGEISTASNFKGFDGSQGFFLMNILDAEC